MNDTMAKLFAKANGAIVAGCAFGQARESVRMTNPQARTLIVTGGATWLRY